LWRAIGSRFAEDGDAEAVRGVTDNFERHLVGSRGSRRRLRPRDSPLNPNPTASPPLTEFSIIKRRRENDFVSHGFSAMPFLLI